MCGIAGFWSPQPGSFDSMNARIRRMTDRIIHRGPDDAGAWMEEDQGLVLGHRRLSIIDTSPTGHQPMLSACGRYCIAFNGEIYNFGQLRRDLSVGGSAPQWRGSSDTEVMLAAITAWGLDDALTRFDGMFAFALWDRAQKVLTLARDRMGEKPLYYGWTRAGFVFGSELKALTALPEWDADIDRESLAQYFFHGYVPSPASIYRNFRKLTAGSTISLSTPTQRPAPQPYWVLDPMASSQGAHFDDRESVDRLDALLRRVVSEQMVADVPLGAFLSGGVDSTTIVALMQTHSPTRVKTFTIGFEESAFDESVHARRIAGHLGTEHLELRVGSADALAVIPSLPEIYDEPFGDSSAIPTFLVAKLARSRVTVSLSGDGGDELFGGYGRHIQGPAFWRWTGWMPLQMRKAGAALIRALPGASPDRADEAQRPVGEMLHRIADLVSASDRRDLYARFIAHWDSPGLVRGVSGTRSAPPPLASGDLAMAIMAADAVGYLPDDILAKVDRASMRVSLESRMPLLDRRMVEFAFALPRAMKIRNGRGKWILREVLKRYVPEDLTSRSKMGFSLPVAQWLRGPLRDWSEALLDASRLRREGFLDDALVQEKWRQHVGGGRDWGRQLWCVLMFQAWLEKNRQAGTA